jgi:hypothetical protein
MAFALATPLAKGGTKRLRHTTKTLEVRHSGGWQRAGDAAARDFLDRH